MPSDLVQTPPLSPKSQAPPMPIGAGRTKAPPARALDVETGFSSLCGPRERNEDYVGVYLGKASELSRTGVVAAIADGVSSGSGSRVAAELAVRGFIEGYIGEIATRGVKRVGGQSVAAVNAWVHHMGRNDSALAGMATTLTVLILRGRTAHVLHVGDSRLYRMRQGELALLTTDHILNAFEARHVLTRSIGSHGDVMLDYAAETLQVGDRYLLCTDGVHGVLSDRALAQSLAADATPEVIAKAITAQALAAHGTDNTTALVVDVSGLPDALLSDVESAVASLPIIVPPKVGDVIDGFRMDKIVADGFYTRVFKATDLARSATVLAKFPKDSVVSDAVMRQAFLRENWISALVRSPWIGEGLVREQSQLFALMTWYDGETLDRRIARQPPLSLAEGLTIAIKLIKGVVALHRSGIVHRDIKPDNIILEANGGVRLVDLGVARVPQLEDAPQAVAPGTPNFMAPELYAGSLGDERSDIFAIAVTIYRLFTGAFPYSETDSVARPAFRLGSPLTVRRPDLPAWLSATLARAYAFAPHERPADAIELLFELEHGQLRGSTRPAAPLPLYQRNPLLIWKLACAALAIALLITIFPRVVPLPSRASVGVPQQR